MSEKAQKSQPPQLSAEIQQQISTLNGRIGNANFAQGDLFREIENTFKIMVTTIVALQKENAELKSERRENRTPQ